MFYTIYKITNQLNQKYYIGKHKTVELNDDYMGSGKLIRRAIAKHGIENFKKEILFVFDNELEMNEKEKELVEVNEQTYNLNEGGKGGFDFINRNGLTKGANNIMVVNPTSKYKCIEAGKITRSKNPEFYANIAKTNLTIAHKKQIGKKRPEHAEKMKSISKKIWQENREKIRDKLSDTYKIIDQYGNEYITNRLKDFCLRHNIPFVTIWNSSVSGKRISKGKAKDWLCLKITAL